MYLIDWYRSSAQSSKTDGLVNRIEDKVIEWRRDFHQHPELVRIGSLRRPKR